jgi:hypothetical protein
MRNWTATHTKAAAARGCRVCGRTRKLDRAHTIARARDRHGRVDPDDVVLLCGPFPAGCHGAYDAHRLDLYPHLTNRELAAAVKAAGSAGLALRRLSAPLWRDPAATPILDVRLAHLEALGA